MLTVFSLLLHVALTGWHGGALASNVASSAEVATITICAGGRLQQIAVDANGQRVSESERPDLATSCPFCAVLTAADKGLLSPDTHLAAMGQVTPHAPDIACHIHDNRIPFVRHGLDPPQHS